MKKKITLAIIENDEIYVYLVKKAIAQSPLVDQIKVFDNGLDAINYLKQNAKNEDLIPDIILLDLSMPVMDGWQFLDEYSAVQPKIKKPITIDIVTSSLSPDDAIKARSISSVSNFIIKPTTREKFIEIVAKMISKS